MFCRLYAKDDEKSRSFSAKKNSIAKKSYKNAKKHLTFPFVCNMIIKRCGCGTPKRAFSSVVRAVGS